ncbi:MAG TPA: hypothetical protein VIJ23_05030 [Mycobacterium sp.]
MVALPARLPQHRDHPGRGQPPLIRARSGRQHGQSVPAGRWWLPDTSVLYIGKAGPTNPLRTRVHQFVKTSIGAAGPHRGGQ